MTNKTHANIIFRNNGGWVELDDGSPLDGREVRVAWPDGTYEEASLRVISRRGVRSKTLAIVTSHHGAEALVAWPAVGVGFMFLD